MVKEIRLLELSLLVNSYIEKQTDAEKTIENRLFSISEFDAQLGLESDDLLRCYF